LRDLLKAARGEAIDRPYICSSHLKTTCYLTSREAPRSHGHFKEECAKTVSIINWALFPRCSFCTSSQTSSIKITHHHYMQPNETLVHMCVLQTKGNKNSVGFSSGIPQFFPPSQYIYDPVIKKNNKKRGQQEARLTLNFSRENKDRSQPVTHHSTPFHQPRDSSSPRVYV